MYPDLISELSGNDLLVSLLTQLKTICVIQLIINCLGIIVSILLFIPVCSTNQENLQRSRRLVIPWVVWCIVEMVNSAGFFIWFFAKVSQELHNTSNTPLFAYAKIFYCVFNIWAAVIGISYYQWLNEEHGAPSNPIVMETLLKDP